MNRSHKPTIIGALRERIIHTIQGKSWDSLVSTNFDEWFGRSTFEPPVKGKAASLKAYNGWVYDAANLISNVVSDAELGTYIIQGDEEVPITEDRFKFLTVWDKPNQLMSGRELRKLTQTYIELAAEGYLVKVRNGIGFPGELWPIPPTDMELKYDRGVYYYEQSTKAGKVNWRLEDVIYLRFINPSNLYGGFGALQAKGTQHDTDVAIDKWHKVLYEDGAWVQYALSTKESMTGPQMEQVREAFYNSVKNVKDKFKPPILPKGLEMTELRRGAGELGTEKTTSTMRDKVLAGFGVSKALLGMSDGVLRANLEGTNLVFSKNVIEPRLRMWEDAFRPTFRELDSRVNIRFKSTVPKDLELRRKDTEALAKMGAISIEEVRERFGMDPDFREGDTPITVAVPQGFGSPNNQGGDSGTSDNKTAPDDSNGDRPKGSILPASISLPASPALGKSFWTQERKDTYQKQFEDETEARERRWMPPIKGWVGEWEKEGLKIIARAGKMAAAKYAGWGIARVRADYVAKAEVPDAIEILILEASGKLHTMDYKEAGEEMIAFLGFADPFDMSSEPIVSYLKNKTRMFTDTQTLKYADDIERILQEGITAGETVAEMSATFQELMGWESEGYRATRIARTEVIGASNKARREAMEQAGVPKKSWSSARDAIVRDSHVEADRRYSADPIPVTEEFVLSSGATGDPVNTGEASEDINCRCSLRPERDEEE